MSDERDRQLDRAHRRIGKARKIVEDFWARVNAANPYDRETAWAMHVAMVQLAEIFERRKGKSAGPSTDAPSD